MHWPCNDSTLHLILSGFGLWLPTSPLRFCYSIGPYSGSVHPCLYPLLLNLQPVRVPLVSSSNPSFFLYTWIMAAMGTSSSYTHLKFQASIPSFFTLGLWLQWALHNTFKLYTLKVFSLKHNETFSQTLKIFQIQLKLFINAKVHSTICSCNKCTKNLTLTIDYDD